MAIIHGHARRKNKSTTWTIWKHMRSRCQNPKIKAYKDYGGRGIMVCERWNTFSNFLEDMGERPSKEFSLERINNDGNYEPSNCKWATATEQIRNRRKNKSNTSGFTGVTWYKHHRTWAARIRVGYKMIFLGEFKEIDDAIQARKNGEIKYWGKPS